MNQQNQSQDNDQDTQDNSIPQLPGGLTFEARGFNSEPAAGEGELEVSAEEADRLASEIQQQGQEASVEDRPQEAEEGESEETAPETAPIKIGDRVFKDQTEAWSYAQELERARLADEAFRQGVEAASRAQGVTPQAATPPPDAFANFETEFYADPKEYMRQALQKTAAQAKEEALREINQQERYKQTWIDFYSDYPDLQDHDWAVKATLNEEFAKIHSLETKTALKLVADKVRGRLGMAKAQTAPGKELPKTKVATSPGNGISVTPKVKEEKQLNFTQQMKNLNKKRVARGIRR